jgi:hypothetical protein
MLSFEEAAHSFKNLKLVTFNVNFDKIRLR